MVNDTGGSVTGDGSNVAAADAAAEEIRQRGGQAVGDTHSVTTPGDGQVTIDTALRAGGRVDHGAANSAPLETGAAGQQLNAVPTPSGGGTDRRQPNCWTPAVAKRTAD